MVRRRGRGSIVLRRGKAYAQVTIAGKRTLRVIRRADGSACADDLVEAEALLPALLAKIDREGEIRSGRGAHLGEWLDVEYGAVLESRLSPPAAEMAESYLVRFCDWSELAIAPLVPMRDVGRADAERFVADFLAGRCPPPRGREDRKAAEQRTYKPSYLRRVVNVLRRAWYDAKARGLVDENPWSRMRLPRVVEKSVPWISPADFDRLLGHVHATHAAILRTIAWTGLRVGEARALRVEDLDLERGSLFVRHGKTAGATRVVPLAAETVELLRAQEARDDGLVFEPFTAESIRQRLKTACRHADLPELTTHQLRHVYASHLAVSGGHPRDVAAVLGHSDGGKLALRRYARWFPPDSTTRAVQRLREFRATRGSDASSPGTPAPPPNRSDAGPSADATPRPRSQARP